MKVSSLLNPTYDEPREYRGPRIAVEVTVPASEPLKVLEKRQKIAKDAPIFAEGNKIVGTVNYPPYEACNDGDLQAEHQRFRVFPLGEIRRKGIRHIPYNSDKKDFIHKTGRDAFEVFQYTYKIPGEDKEYVVVWDYNIGLVRMTPFFKSCKFTKTVPAKALNQNHGLKDISYSITGGALVCQGYWMPYQAAKAIAATFCYHIRWALTPVFGNDFPSLCTRQKDNSATRFVIDPKIVRYCAEETNRFRTEGACYRLTSQVLPSPMNTTRKSLASPLRKPRAIKERYTRPAEMERVHRLGTPKYDSALRSPLNSPRWTHLNKPMSPASLSPEVSPRSGWTAVNRPLSPATPSTMTHSAMVSPIMMTQAAPLLQMPTPKLDDDFIEQGRTKRTHSKVAMGDDWAEEHVADRTAPVPRHGHHGQRSGSVGKAKKAGNEFQAAEVLLSLSRVPSTKRTRRSSTI
ncbi:hypothetical protein ACEQ8H_003180 [Pleosporales sp. CAS-2024a]